MGKNPRDSKRQLDELLERSGPRLYILDKNKRLRRATTGQWMRWFAQNGGSVRIGMTRIGPRVGVSTVFLGIDRRLFGIGRRPLVYETMIFGGPLNGEQRRYSSWDDAETGHRDAVRKARAAQKARS